MAVRFNSVSIPCLFAQGSFPICRGAIRDFARGPATFPDRLERSGGGIRIPEDEDCSCHAHSTHDSGVGEKKSRQRLLDCKTPLCPEDIGYFSPPPTAIPTSKPPSPRNNLRTSTMSLTYPPYPTGDRNILARLANEETFRRFPPGGE